MTLDELEFLFTFYAKQSLFRQCRLRFVTDDTYKEWKPEDVRFVLQLPLKTYEEVVKAIEKRGIERFFTRMTERFESINGS